MTADPAVQKRLVRQMLLANVLLTLVALGFAVGHFGYAVAWMLYAFVGAVVAGFAAQIWFIASLRKKG